MSHRRTIHLASRSHILSSRAGTCRTSWSNPQPADVVLVVEIANTTLGFDLTTRARLHARAGIADYWVVDVPGWRIIVHRDPVDGVYRMVASYAEEELVPALAAAGADLRIADIFPA